MIAETSSTPLTQTGAAPSSTESSADVRRRQDYPTALDHRYYPVTEDRAHSIEDLLASSGIETKPEECDETLAGQSADERILAAVYGRYKDSREPKIQDLYLEYCRGLEGSETDYEKVVGNEGRIDRFNAALRLLVASNQLFPGSKRDAQGRIIGVRRPEMTTASYRARLRGEA